MQRALSLTLHHTPFAGAARCDGPAWLRRMS
jgi:hypothetical protein